MFCQSRTVCCIVYSLEDIQSLISQFSFADYEYAYILHDKDLKSDGSLKEPHYHFYGSRKSPITEQTLKNFVKTCKQNVLYENLKSTDNALLRYFLHCDNNDKYQYKEEDIVSNFDVHSRLYKGVSSTVNPVDIINMFDNGFTTLEIIRKYPKLIYSIANLQRYEKLVKAEKYKNQPCSTPKIEFNLVQVSDDNLPF